MQHRMSKNWPEIDSRPKANNIKEYSGGRYVFDKLPTASANNWKIVCHRNNETLPLLAKPLHPSSLNFPDFLCFSLKLYFGMYHMTWKPQTDHVLKVDDQTLTKMSTNAESLPYRSKPKHLSF